MHNRLSVRRYSVSTGAYILIVVQELGLQQVKRGWSPMRHTMRCYLVARHNGQWNIRGRKKKKGTRNRYQEQKHDTRITCVSSTTKQNRNRTRGITTSSSGTNQKGLRERGRGRGHYS